MKLDCVVRILFLRIVCPSEIVMQERCRQNVVDYLNDIRVCKLLQQVHTAY